MSRSLSLSKRTRYRTITFNETSSGSINHIIREHQSAIALRGFYKNEEVWWRYLKYVSLRLISMAKDTMLRQSMTGRFMERLCDIYNCYFTFLKADTVCMTDSAGGFSNGIWKFYEKSHRLNMLLREVFVLLFNSLNKITSKQFKTTSYWK